MVTKTCTLHVDLAKSWSDLLRKNATITNKFWNTIFIFIIISVVVLLKSSKERAIQPLVWCCCFYYFLHSCVYTCRSLTRYKTGVIDSVSLTQSAEYDNLLEINDLIKKTHTSKPYTSFFHPMCSFFTVCHCF